MKRWFATALLVGVWGAGVGCQRGAAPQSGEAVAAAPEGRPIHLLEAQPRLPTLALWLGAHELTVEVARRPVEIATGMMFRTNLAETEGMLFVFPQPHQASFYMRNTRVPLSAAYIAPDGAILEIRDLQPLDETPVTAASDQVQYVLEVAQGWFERHGVKTGALVRTPYGALGALDWRTLRPRGR